MQTFQAFFAERTLAFAALRHPHGPSRPGQDLSRELIEHVLAHAHDIVPRRQALHYHDLPQTSEDGPLILLSCPTPSALRVRFWLGAKLLLTQAVPAITDRRGSWMCLLGPRGVQGRRMFVRCTLLRWDAAPFFELWVGEVNSAEMTPPWMHFCALSALPLETPALGGTDLRVDCVF